MGTRAYICVELSPIEQRFFNTTKCFMGVFCALDGNVVGGVGETLYRYYNSREKASRLIRHGSIRSLGNYIKDTNFFDKKKSTLAIIGDEDSVFFDMNEIKTKFGVMIEYLYIYTIKGGWSWYKGWIRNDTRWRSMGYIKDMAYFKGSLIN